MIRLGRLFGSERHKHSSINLPKSITPDLNILVFAVRRKKASPRYVCFRRAFFKGITITMNIVHVKVGFPLSFYLELKRSSFHIPTFLIKQQDVQIRFMKKIHKWNLFLEPATPSGSFYLLLI